MTIDCNVVDAGARYGLHPTWQPLENIATFHLYELDLDEVNRLKEKYRKKCNIFLNHMALYSSETEVLVNAHQHKALNSIYDANIDFLNSHGYMQNEYGKTDQYTVDARTLDSIYPEKNIHFLKLDTEGSELEILKGGVNLLTNSIIGIRSEVFFARLLKAGTSFAELNEFLYEHNFELINFDYDGRGAARSPFTQTEKFGKIMSTDGVWILKEDHIFNSDRENLEHDIIRLSLFLMLNNATDIALSLLLRAVNQEKIGFCEYWQDPLFLFLHKKIAILFKEISYLPSIELDLLQKTYNQLFNREFPKLNSFNESSFLND